MTAFAARGGWWVVGQIAIFSAAIIGSLVVDDRSGLDGTALTAQRALGALLLVTGAVLAVAGLLALGRSLTPFPAPVAGGELIEHGIYRLARHPIYGGVALGFVGLGCALDGLLLVGCGLALFPYFLAKASFEERHLAASYPGYRAYAARVKRRLLPWII